MAMAAAGALVLAPSCKEDDTLEGATEVYVSISPSAISLTLGDVVEVSASVSNISGNAIDTPVKWSIDDETIAEVVNWRDTVFMDGDTIFNEADSTYTIPKIVKSIGDVMHYGVKGKAGAQGKTTKLRATLENGKFAIASVSVTTHKAEGVTPLTESKRSYRASDIEVTDTAWFSVSPWSILDDYKPVAELKKVDDGPAEVTLADDYIFLNEKAERVGVLFHPDRSYGTYEVTLTVGGNGNTASATTEIVIGPNIKVGMWDPDPSMNMSPPTGDQFYEFFYEVRKTVNINSDVEVYARFMVEGARAEDIANAKGSYKWEVESGNSLLVTGMREVPCEYGYDCVLSLRSGLTPGENVINFCSPDTAALVMKAYITVLDFDKDFPVDDIVITPVDPEQSMDNLVAMAGKNIEFNASIEPLTSLAYHRPTVKIEDRTVLDSLSYNGTLLVLKGLKPGKTTVTLTALDKTKSFDVTVMEELVQMTWGNTVSNLLVGQTENFSLNIVTESKQPNTYPVTWTSSDPNVVSVEGTTDSATVTAKGKGKATITATVTSYSGKTLTMSHEVTVKDGMDDVIVDPTTSPDGSSGIMDDGLFISLENSETSSINLYTKEPKTQFTGTLTTADFTGADVDGSSAEVVDASLNIESIDDYNVKVNGTVTLSISGNEFKVIFNNAPLYR